MPSLLVRRKLTLGMLGVAVLLSVVFNTDHIHAAEPKKVALLVGVNKYLKAGLRNLDFPEADVEAVGGELQRLGFQVTVLKGSGSGTKQATRENIESTAKSLVKPLGKEDLMLLMLSGHGLQREVGEAGKEKHEEGFYCPVDAVPNDTSTLTSLSHLTDDILAPNVGKKLVLIDACRDVPKDPGRSAKGIQGRVISLPEDTAVMFGCRAGQQSYESDQLGHGLFTHCLLEGLQGKAAKDGQITWTRLAAYVEERLSASDMKKYMPGDHPQEAIAAGGVGQLVLARLDVPKVTPVVPARPFGGKFEGTSWTVADSDGDRYTITFQTGGVLHYDTTRGPHKNGTWTQAGDSVTIETNSGFGSLRGTIAGNELRGTGTNAQGKKWTWQAVQK